MIGEKYGEIKKVEEIINFTYRGLTLLIRDTNLGNLDSKYEVGMILRELGFTDASLHRGGLLTTHRMAILSNHYADLQAYEYGTNWGLCVMDQGSYFKVLDQYTIEDKTQITLLHLPENDWEIFGECHTNVDPKVVNIIRNDFEKSIILAPAPELSTNQWLKRCSYPIGMTDEGGLFSIKRINR
ncbi:hypothetical protein [Acetobacterium sp.]|uniref:hypothetical protein n=1 Tax=Acetobacterium sp. TaxID=1872094 RepID=UPI002F40C2B4